ARPALCFCARLCSAACRSLPDRATRAAARKTARPARSKRPFQFYGCDSLELLSRSRRLRQSDHDRALALAQIALRDPLQIRFRHLLVAVPDRIDQARVVVENREMAERVGARAAAVDLLGALPAQLHP